MSIIINQYFDISQQLLIMKFLSVSLLLDIITAVSVNASNKTTHFLGGIWLIFYKCIVKILIEVLEHYLVETAYWDRRIHLFIGTPG